jgi:hypothetical protein
MNTIIPLTAAGRERLFPTRCTFVQKTKSAIVRFAEWPLAYKMLFLSVLLMGWMGCVDLYFKFKH